MKHGDMMQMGILPKYEKGDCIMKHDQTNKNDSISRKEVLAFLDAKANACLANSPAQIALQSAIEYIKTL